MKKFDIFISYKNLDHNGLQTRDSVIAKELFYFLTSKKLNVFFSTISLESIGESEYKNVIDDALDSSKILIAVGTKVEYLQSKWVKYEWDSFVNDILSGINKNGRIFTVVEDIDIAKLPRSLRQNQIFGSNKESLDSLYNYIKNALKNENLHIDVTCPVNFSEAMELIKQKAASKGFVIIKQGTEMRVSKSGTEYVYAHFRIANSSKGGVLYCHTSGKNIYKVFFLWRGINWYYQIFMKGAQKSFLGLPVSDEYVVNEKNPFIARNDFENGYIEYIDINDELNVYKLEAGDFSLVVNHKF